MGIFKADMPNDNDSFSTGSEKSSEIEDEMSESEQVDDSDK